MAEEVYSRTDVDTTETKEEVCQIDVVGETANEDDIDTRFVGRRYYLNEIEKNFKRHRIFGVFGLRAVGKSRLVDEFCKRIQNQHLSLLNHEPSLGSEHLKNLKPVRVITVNLRVHDDTGSLHSAICSSLGIVPVDNAIATGSWKRQIVGAFAKRNEELFILHFDNAEDTVEDKTKAGFLSLVSELAKHCGNVKTFITSTTKVMFASLGKLYYNLELFPLPPTEAATLLQLAAPSVDLGEDRETIVKLSEGLPLLLLMIGSELSEVSPRHMVEMLANFRLEALSRDFYPSEQRAADVYRKFIERLCQIYQERFAVLGYIPGSFDTQEAKELLGHDTDALTKHETLIPIRRRHMLTYDPTNERFDIQGILRECLSVYYTIKDIPGVRDRYIRTFSRVMLEMGRQLRTADFAAAAFRFGLEQPNLVKLLTEVPHSNRENYSFFLEIATSCTAMIEKFMSGVSDTFYDGCLKVVDEFGRQVDKASIYIAIGSLAMNSKGNYPLGEENYHNAIKILQPHGKSLSMIQACSKLGWCLHNQGKNFESLSWLQKSLEMSGNQHETVSLQTLSCMGVVHNWIGNYDKARSCHEAVLNRRKKLVGDDHVELAGTLNNLGLVYDNLGQHQTALKHYQEGLRLKRKNMNTVWVTVWSVVASLSNVAVKYTTLQKYDEAKQHLDEALDILNKTDNPHKGALSLIHNSYGKLYRAMGDHKKASEMFGIAVDMRREIMMDSIPYIWSAINLANVLKERKQYSKAVFLVNDILKRKESALKRMPHNDFVLKCLELKAEVYRASELTELGVKVADDIEAELLRLREVYADEFRQDKVTELDKRLKELRLETHPRKGTWP